MAEYVLARLAHGVADGTIRGEITAVEQFLAHAGVFAWEAEPAHADRFLGQAQRHQAPETRRGEAGAIDLFFRFLEARYRGEIHELTGRVVVSPIDACNRPGMRATSMSASRRPRRRALEERDEELAAARETNRRLMNQLNRTAT